MRKTGRGIFCLVLCLCLLSGCGGKSGLRLPQPPANGCVLDMAGVLERDTVTWIQEQNQTLSAVDAKLTVVTVDTLGGSSAAQYAAGLFDEWELDGQKGGGVLLLLAIGDGEYHLIQGAPIAADLTDQRLADYAWNYLERDFEAGSYDAGARKVLDALFGWYRSHYAQDLGLEPTGEDLPAQEGSAGGFPWLAVIFALAVLALVVLVAVKLRQRGDENRRGGRRRASRYHGSRRRK